MKNDAIPFLLTALLTAGLKTTATSGAPSAVVDDPGTEPSRIHATLNDVTFARETFVAVGREGIILTSPDGLDWERQDSDCQANLFAVSAGDDLVVAVGDEGTIVVSPNGVDCWARAKSGTKAPLRDVAFGNGRYVALGSYNTILISEDGWHWSKADHQLECNFRSISFGNGKWIVSGSGGTLFHSDDGKKWSPVVLGFRSVCHGKLFFADGASFLIYRDHATRCCLARLEPEGTSKCDLVGTGACLKGMAKDRDLTVLVGRDGVVIASMGDGRWGYRNSGTCVDLFGVAYGKGRFVVVGREGTILRSDDGSSWESAPRR